MPIEAGQTIPQPYIVALMLQLLKPAPADRVLEVGTGSGYGAAVLSRIVSVVYTVERCSELAESAQARFEKLAYRNIHVKIANGTMGWPSLHSGAVLSGRSGSLRMPRNWSASSAADRTNTGMRNTDRCASYPWWARRAGRSQRTRIMKRGQPTGSSEFYVDFNIEMPTVGAEFAQEAERGLRELADGHKDLVGAMVSLENIVESRNGLLV